MNKKYTRKRTAVKPLDDERVIVDARAWLLHSLAFENCGRRIEIVGQDEDERGAA